MRDLLPDVLALAILGMTRRFRKAGASPSGSRRAFSSARSAARRPNFKYTAGVEERGADQRRHRHRAGENTREDDHADVSVGAVKDEPRPPAKRRTRVEPGGKFSDSRTSDRRRAGQPGMIEN